MKESSIDQPGASERSLSLGVIFLTLFIDLIGFSIIFPLFPGILEHYLSREGSDGLLGALLEFLRTFDQPGEGSGHYLPVLFGGFLGAIYAFLQFLSAPFWGRLSDRFGRRTILLFTVGGTALSYGLWFFSGSFLLFILARLLGGLMAGNLSVASAAIADVTPPERRAKGMALVGIAFGLGFIMGPAIGGLSAHLDILALVPALEAWGVNPFSGPALVAFILSAGNLIWVWRRFRETLPPDRRGNYFEERTPGVLLRARLRPELRRANWVFFVYVLAFSGMEFTLTFLASQRFDYGPAQLAYLFVYVGLIIVLTQGLLVRKAVPLIGEKAVTIWGLLLVAIGLLLVGLAHSPVLLYGGLAFMAVGSGFINPALSALVSLYAAADKQGATMGVFRSLGSLGRAIGPLVASFLFWWYGATVSYAVGAIILLVPLLIAFSLPKPARGGQV